MKSGDFLRFLLLVLCGACFIAASESWGQVQHRVSAFQRVATNQVHITLTTPANESYTILRSSNLVDWVPAGPLPPVSFDGDKATYLLEINPEKPVAAYQAAYEPVPPNPEPIAQLDAPATEAVVAHLPDMGMPFEDEVNEVSMENDLPISLTHLLVHFKASTTVQSLNELLTAENLTLAGTVPVMNLGVLRRDVVTTLADLNALAERLTASGLFSAVALNMGMSLPRTFENPLPQLNRVGRQRGFLNWTWEVMGLGKGFGGNNGFEMSRVPQMWNWLDYAYRQRARLGGHEVAVLEFAFNPHNDIDTNVVLGATSNSSLDQSYYDHGIAVMGIIAAKRNSAGTDGVTPLPDVVRGIPFLVNNTSVHSYAGTDLGQLASILIGENAPKVINISSGMPWYQIGDPTITTRVPGVTYAEWMDDLGALWAGCFETLNQNISRTNYLIVCSAGNDDGVDAAYSSPMANIACRPELRSMAPQFLTVESVSEDRTTSDYSNYDASGQGDSVSAGGTDVTVLQGPQANAFSHVDQSGTSYAAPLVTGIASFLWSLEPSLSIFEMKQLLMGTNTTFEVQGGERGNLVDGFSAALDIDRLRADYVLQQENFDRQRALVDVDDGTRDGNLRAALMNFEKNPDQIHTADGRRGDGVINMKDFRAFRDAWLQVNGEDKYLDGPPMHFKRDLNFDGLVFDQPVSPPHPAPYNLRSTPGESLPEEIYSRYDFNGNGFLDQDGQSASPSLDSLSPFKVDPDKEPTGRNLSQGFYRDIDVLLDEAIWEQDEENVVLSGAPPFPDELPVEWTTNNFTTLYVSYLQSFDMHIDMDGGNPDGANDNYNEHPYFPEREGLQIQSYFSVTKARTGDWEGVITIPFDVIADFPTVSVHYRKTVGDEFHQYLFSFLAAKGEDLALVLGFDELQFYSNTREFTSFFTDNSNNPVSEEVIGKRPGAGSYGSVLIPFEDYTTQEVKDRARELAIEALADRLKFPVALNGSPGLEAIYKTRSEAAGVLVEVYGIRALYDDIVGTLISPSKAPGEKGKRAARSDASLDGI
ncbi:S8 family serine peptidase [bacterium]|nr:S8 family serine peptidase [bacterium]